MAEYTISKIKLPNGDICNIKDTTYNFNTAYNATTNKAATMADIKTDNIKPIKSASFTTGKYGQDGSGTHYYEMLGSITPTSFEQMWLLHYIITIEVSSDTTYTYRADVEIYGVRNTYGAYKIFNSYYSKYPIYQHVILEGASNSYPHEFGYRLASSYGDTTVNKNIHIDIIETRNCTAAFFNAPKAYTSSTPSNYVWRTFNATSNGLQETGDSDTITRLYADNNSMVVSSNFRLPGAAIFGFDRDNHAQGISLYSDGYTNTTTSINVSRVYNTAGFDWTKGLFYNTSSNFATGAEVTPGIDQSIHAIDFRYTDNCVASSTLTTLGLERYKAIYLRGTIGTDGLFYLAPLTVSYNSQNYKRAWTQDIPTSVDGYVYWFLGFPYYNSSYAGGYQLNFYLKNKLYAYYDGKFQEYIPTISITDKTSGTLPITRGGTGAITDSSARNNLGLGNVSNNSNLNNITGAKGDIIYWSATNTPAHLTNTSSTTKQFLSITSQVPSWSSVSKSDVGLGNVENTALSTWAGTNKITTLGTITTGTWQGTAIAASYIGNHSTDKLTSGTLPVARGGTGQTSIANIQAGKDGDGNTISSTYLKLSGGTLTGNLTLSATSGDSPALIFNRDGSSTDWKILVTSGKLSFQSSTDASTWTERASFADNSGNFTTTGTITATKFIGPLEGNVTGNASGTAANVTGTVAVDHGGTGATTASAARTNLEITPANIGAVNKTGDTMMGPLKWNDGTALPASNTLAYFLGIDAFDDGGTTHYITAANLRTAIGAVNKAGDTMTGALNFANNTWNLIGDDVQIGDQNIGGHLCIQGKTGTTGIHFVQNGGSNAANIDWDGSNFQIGQTLVLSKQTDAAASTDNGPALVVGGTRSQDHLELDGNEIMAKTNGTSAAVLYLNNDGGMVQIGSGGLQMTGQLILKPAGSEGGQILLAAPSDHPERAGIIIDQQSGSNFRIFGNPSADGTSYTGNGTALVINPYAKTITGGYTFTGNVTGNATNVTGTVAVAHGGTGTTAAGWTALNNLGLKQQNISVTLSNGQGDYSFSSSVYVVGYNAINTSHLLVMQRSSGRTKYKFYDVFHTSYSGTVSVDVFYI